jgi:hypothetical protein
MKRETLNRERRREGGMGGLRSSSPTLPVLLLCLSCGPSAPARSPEASVHATNLAAPQGTTLIEACTPTGPELCFNAVDDNCNGIIDEGCGVQTGLLQFAAAWGASKADVNLSVCIPPAPNAECVPNERTKSTASGFRLDKDCPGEEGCFGQNIENVYFDGLEPPKGHYIVHISLGELNGADSPVKVRFGARLGSKSVGFDVDLAPGDEKTKTKTFQFDLP